MGSGDVDGGGVEDSDRREFNALSHEAVDGLREGSYESVVVAVDRQLEILRGFPKTSRYLAGGVASRRRAEALYLLGRLEEAADAARAAESCFRELIGSLQVDLVSAGRSGMLDLCRALAIEAVSDMRLGRRPDRAVTELADTIRRLMPSGILHKGDEVVLAGIAREVTCRSAASGSRDLAAAVVDLWERALLAGDAPPDTTVRLAEALLDRGGCEFASKDRAAALSSALLALETLPESSGEGSVEVDGLWVRAYHQAIAAGRVVEPVPSRVADVVERFLEIGSPSDHLFQDISPLWRCWAAAGYDEGVLGAMEWIDHNGADLGADDPVWDFFMIAETLREIALRASKSGDQEMAARAGAAMSRAVLLAESRLGVSSEIGSLWLSLVDPTAISGEQYETAHMSIARWCQTL